MAQRIPTRLGDGSLVEMTGAEIEADLHAGSEAAAQARQGRAARRRTSSTTCSTSSPRRRKFSAVDYGDEVVLSFDGSGNADIGAAGRSSRSSTRTTTAPT